MYNYHRGIVSFHNLEHYVHHAYLAQSAYPVRLAHFHNLERYVHHAYLAQSAHPVHLAHLLHPEH